MSLYGIVTLAAALLSYRGRISYQALRQQFELDDAGLEALRIELIQVEQIAQDEGGEFLVLNGQAITSTQPIAPLKKLEPLQNAKPNKPLLNSQSVEVPNPSMASEPPSQPTVPAATASDAERRPLTVMFCDLADSTALSTKLDPEDLQDVIRAYQKLATGIIQEYEGYIAKYMGDGILVYFGYPKSLERNAERAVRSGLAIIEALAGLNHTLGQDNSIDIAVRIGVSTGMVVVGELMGEGLAQERTVIGEAPNVAARLQGLAPRNGIVIGSLTKELTGDVFEYEDLGSHELKGITGAVTAWNVRALKTEVSASDQAVLANGAVTKLVLVGRDEETGLLHRAWQSMKDEGRGQVVAITGEAGIGKSVLVDGLKLDVRQEGLPRVTFLCSPYHTGSALYPAIEHFKQLAGWDVEDSVEVRITKLEDMLTRYSVPLDDSMPLFASLLSLPLPEDRFAPLELSPQQLKQQTQDTILALTFEEAERQPFLHIWEDLHWADPSTLELLGLLIEQNPTASLLIVLTSRPEFVPPWPARSHITPITLNRLERSHTEALVYRLAGEKRLPEEVSDHIVTKTDGVPLYVEELTKTILASDILKENDSAYELTGPLTALSIPETLQESLMARLDRLPQVREIAQIGSVLGREFAYEMISGLSPISDELLEQGLSQLVDAELLYQRGRPPRAKYIFKHALVQDAAYESLLKRSRTQYHAQFADLLEARFGDIVEAHPALIAHHFSEAGSFAKALPYWQQAAKSALGSWAMVEAVGHLEAALAAVEELSEGDEREQSEWEVQMLLGPAKLATRGFAYPPLEDTYNRALELCEKLDKPVDTIKVTRGLQAFHLGGGRLTKADELAGRIADRVASLDDAALRVGAAHVVGQVKFFRGEFEQAIAELERGIDLYDPTIHRIPNWPGGEPGEQCHLYASFIKWITGHPAAAFAYCDRAIEISKLLGNKFSFANTMAFVTLVHVLNQDKVQALKSANLGVETCREQSNVFWLHFSRALESWAKSTESTAGDCAEEIGRAISDYRNSGARLMVPFLLTRKAECFLEAGRPSDALVAVHESQTLAETTGEHCWGADTLRIKGEIEFALGESGKEEIASNFHCAINLAKQQGAPAWALRAGLSLMDVACTDVAEIEAKAALNDVFNIFGPQSDLPEIKRAEQILGL